MYRMSCQCVYKSSNLFWSLGKITVYITVKPVSAADVDVVGTKTKITIIKWTKDVQFYVCDVLLPPTAHNANVAINNNTKQKLKEASQGVESNQGRLGLGASLSISFYILKVHDWRCGCYPHYHSAGPIFPKLAGPNVLARLSHTSCALPGK